MNIPTRSTAIVEDGLYVQRSPSERIIVGFMYSPAPWPQFPVSDPPVWEAKDARVRLMSDEAIASVLSSPPPQNGLDYRTLPFLWHRGPPENGTWYEVFFGDMTLERVGSIGEKVWTNVRWCGRAP